MSGAQASPRFIGDGISDVDFKRNETMLVIPQHEITMRHETEANRFRLCCF